MTIGGAPDAADPALLRTLERAQQLGFLGPGPVGDHLTHAAGYLPALADVQGRIADLGSGAGVPGLPIALARPDLEVVLVDAGERRAAFLRRAVEDLGLADRVEVVLGRAESVGRSELRGRLDAVVARGFGAPAVTAECAAPLLRRGGRLLVSEPPQGGERWPPVPLAGLGLAVGRRWTGPPALQALEQVAPCPERCPRRDGVPAKRPLF
jgi:16S rRNA (guanine527-N7)-methyltransferase